ncbi:S-layer homology domain-containing protein [Candidatus Peregrinibacteria bacterium]|nr:MAG: S-layer homology domain-containing protein [Candidatus Peregrinibacteria bacterium]
MKKRFSMPLAAVLMSVFTLAGGAFASFKDVGTSHPHYEAINFVQSEGIVKGYENGTYKPDRNVNRVELVKIIVEAVYEQKEIDGCNVDMLEAFTDVDRSAWYAPYLCMARKKGLIEGYSNGTFKPGNEINFVEMAKILVSAYQFHIDQFSIDPWYMPFVMALDNRQAIPLQIENVASKVTRGQLAEIIFRLNTERTDKPSHTYGTLGK